MNPQIGNPFESPTSPIATQPNIMVPLRHRVLLFTFLMATGVALSAWAYRNSAGGSTFYFGILPGAPFGVLALLSLAMRVPATLGAFVGGLIGVTIPYGALLYTSATYSGGGANIGVGLLLMATPVILPIFMILGGIIGNRFGAAA